jgi:hypothetical protein
MIDFKKLKIIYNKIELNDIQNHFKTIDKSIVIKQLENCSFCWKEVEIYFNDCHRVLEVKTRNITVNFYFQNKKDIPPRAKILLTLKQILTVIDYFKIQTNFLFHVILYNGTRTLPQKNEVLSPEHINGGFTSLHQSQIFILRHEEFSKTMIHEVLHHCSALHNENYTTNQINSLKQNFNISKSTLLIPNEAIIEFFATIIYCTLLAYEVNIKKEILFNIEIHHSIIQSNKIKQLQGNKEWNEMTNAYSYIVFKTILLMNYQRFLKGFGNSYSLQYVVNFLILNKNIPVVKLNSHDKSLRMMTLS